MRLTYQSRYSDGPNFVRSSCCVHNGSSWWRIPHLQKGDPNERFSMGKTALHHAALGGSTQVCECEDIDLYLPPNHYGSLMGHSHTDTNHESTVAYCGCLQLFRMNPNPWRLLQCCRLLIKAKATVDAVDDRKWVRVHSKLTTVPHRHFCHYGHNLAINAPPQSHDHQKSYWQHAIYIFQIHSVDVLCQIFDQRWDCAAPCWWGSRHQGPSIHLSFINLRNWLMIHLQRKDEEGMCTIDICLRHQNMDGVAQVISSWDIPS